MNSPNKVNIIKPHLFKRDYEFILDNKLVAKLHYPKMYSRKAIADSQGKQWRLLRKGFFKRQLEIIAEQSPYTKQTVSFNWRYKVLLTADDRKTYVFKHADCWKRKWVWEDENHETVIEMKSNTWSRKNRGNVILYSDPKSSFLLLMLLGWFIIIAYEDAASGASA